MAKAGGKIWLCANFLTSLNDSLDVHQYALPCQADLFHRLNGRKIFSNAYLQLELNNKSNEIVVINTHKRLFQYNCLPFGAKSALTLFQKVMKQILAGILAWECIMTMSLPLPLTKRLTFSNCGKYSRASRTTASG
uniref:Uncharacterized protein n=1 Tax=Plectus sambesii TaxID=2011161 RepID=A0A914WM11_9BILA